MGIGVIMVRSVRTDGWSLCVPEMAHSVAFG